MKRQKFYSRAFALLLIISVVFTSFTVPVFAEELNGSGTEDNPYVVTSAEELIQIADRINNLQDSEAYIRLDADITVEGSWTPLGKNSVYSYKGTFDGNGHSVTVTVDNPNLSYFGFFGCFVFYQYSSPQYLASTLSIFALPTGFAVWISTG